MLAPVMQACTPLNSDRRPDAEPPDAPCPPPPACRRSQARTMAEIEPTDPMQADDVRWVGATVGPRSSEGSTRAGHASQVWVPPTGPIPTRLPALPPRRMPTRSSRAPLRHRRRRQAAPALRAGPGRSQAQAHCARRPWPTRTAALHRQGPVRASHPSRGACPCPPGCRGSQLSASSRPQ